jgi:hypothetical protein
MLPLPSIHASKHLIIRFLGFCEVLTPSVVKCTTYSTAKSPKYNGFDIMQGHYLLCTCSRLEVLHFLIVLPKPAHRRSISGATYR